MKTKLLLPSLAFILVIGTLRAYDPPLGIPDPSTQFGWEIDRATPAFPAQWTTSPASEVAGHYYVDKTHPSSTDAANPFGHPGKPRKTPPQGVLAAGSFIYVHAGTYDYIDDGAAAADAFDFLGAGTQENPIWITGNPAARPVFSSMVWIGSRHASFAGNASHIIFENFVVTGTKALQIKPIINGDNVDHILVRNVERVGTETATDEGGINIGLSVSTIPSVLSESAINDIVIYNCVVRNIGDKASSDEAGIYNAYPTKRVWVLDNLIHDVASDSVAGSHYSNYTDKLTEDYYIGRNTMFGNGENGIDLKTVLGFVISQNTIYGPFVREQGGGIVVHYGFNSSFHARNGAIIFNNVYHVSAGVSTGLSSGCDNLDIIGNTFWNVKASYAAEADPLNGACILIGGSTEGANSTFRIVNNTFHDYDRGIMLKPSAGDAFKIHGNLFSNRSDPNKYELEVFPSGQETFVTLDSNLYTGTPAFWWANESRSLSYMRSTAGQEADAVLADPLSPLFVDAVNNDFRLAAGSPAIDETVEGPVGDSAYAAYEARFGVGIKMDFEGRMRPVDGNWDIGAFEAFPPGTPSGLRVIP